MKSKWLLSLNEHGQNKVNKLFIDLGLTVKSLSKKSNISEHIIRKFLNGESLRSYNFQDICKVFDLEWSEISKENE